MALFADRVKETTTTTGTGTITLAGAITGYQSFNAAFSTGALVYYTVLSGNGIDWESGLGTFTSSGTTLARTNILTSSNSGSAISLTGTSTVFSGLQAVHAQNAFGAPLIKPPKLSNWTQYNISSPATVADSDAGPVITDTFTAATKFRALLKAAPSTPYTIDACLAVDIPYLNYVAAGLCFSDGTKLQTYGYGVHQITISSTVIPMGCFRLSNVNSGSSFNSEVDTVQYFLPPNASNTFLRIKDDGTNVSFYHSADGVNYNLRFTEAKSAGFLGSSGYSNVGFFLDAEAGTAPSGATINSSITLKSWYVH